MLPLLSFAQYSEIGFQAGMANYQGDLSPVITFDNIDIGQTGGTVSILGRYNFNRFFGVRGSIGYGKIKGDDRLSGDETRVRRNLRFQTDILEAAAMLEFNIFGYDPVYSGKRFSPFIAVGVAGNYFNPRTDFNGRLISLQPLGTEGQGAPGFNDYYSQYSIAIPVGGGLKFALADTWTVGIEVIGRKLFHDYIDDVSGNYAGYQLILEQSGETAALVADRRWELTDSSPAAQVPGGQRGNEKFFDWYYFSTISLTYHLPTNNRQRGKRRRSKQGSTLGCPTF